MSDYTHKLHKWETCSTGLCTPPSAPSLASAGMFSCIANSLSWGGSDLIVQSSDLQRSHRKQNRIKRPGARGGLRVQPPWRELKPRTQWGCKAAVGGMSARRQEEAQQDPTCQRGAAVFFSNPLMSGESLPAACAVCSRCSWGAFPAANFLYARGVKLAVIPGHISIMGWCVYRAAIVSVSVL